MTRVLFIHGTTTRYTSDYLRTFETIRRRLRGWRGQAVVDKFPWGEYWGAEQNPRFVTIPGYDEQAVPGVLGGPADAGGPRPRPEVELWAMLYAEPTAELRLLAAGARATPGTRQSDASAALAGALHLLAAQGPQPPLSDLLAEGGVAATFPIALQRALDLFGGAEPELQDGLHTIGDHALAEYRGALARAIVADAMDAALMSGDDPLLFIDADLRDRTVDVVEQALGGGGVVLGGAQDWLGFLPAAGLTNLVLKPFRTEFTRATLLFFGDIIAYQARRLAIQQAIAAQIGDQPTVLLAHSLGGIACVDLLLSDDSLRSRVPLLITAGSQSGMLHEIGALGSLRVAGIEPTRLPDDFPPWLNLYDRNDMLGFRAAPVFAGQVRDVELDAGQPFPHAHNAYWRNDTAWEHILTALDDPGNVEYQLR